MEVTFSIPQLGEDWGDSMILAENVVIDLPEEGDIFPVYFKGQFLDAWVVKVSKGEMTVEIEPDESGLETLKERLECYPGAFLKWENIGEKRLVKELDLMYVNIEPKR